MHNVSYEKPVNFTVSKDSHLVIILLDKAIYIKMLIDIGGVYDF